MAYKRLSSAVLLGVSLLGLTGQQVVMAEEIDNGMSQNVETPYALAIHVSNTLRPDQTAVDVVVNLPKQFETTKIATVELRNLVGEIVNTLTLTVPIGGRQMTCWFGLTGLPEDRYYVTVSLPDGPVTHSGFSAAVGYSPKTASTNTPSKANKKNDDNTSTVPQVATKEVTETTIQLSQTSRDSKVSTQIIGQEVSKKDVDKASEPIKSSVGKIDKKLNQPASTPKKTVTKKSVKSLADHASSDSRESGMGKLFIGAIAIAGIGLLGCLAYFIKKVG